MKILGSFLRPSLSSVTPFRPHQNAARAFKNFGTAVRSLERGKLGRTAGDGSHIRRLGASRSEALRCFGTSSVAPNTLKEEDAQVTSTTEGRQWPRMAKSGTARKSCHEFHEAFRGTGRGDTGLEELQVCARIWSFRISGNKLAFIDLMQGGVRLQAVCNFQDLATRGVHPGDFKRFIDGLRRGDVISVTGRPHRTQRNELSILACALPHILSPCVRPLPTELKNDVEKMRLRHVDLLIRPNAAQLLRLGSEIKKFLRDYLEKDGHISVKTPILAAAAGGATANPFTIPAHGRKQSIALRIAPELWLKRLIIGGFERIYEIGPSFRNEGEYQMPPTRPQRLTSIRL